MFYYLMPAYFCLISAIGFLFAIFTGGYSHFGTDAVFLEIGLTLPSLDLLFLSFFFFNLASRSKSSRALSGKQLLG